MAIPGRSTKAFPAVVLTLLALTARPTTASAADTATLSGTVVVDQDGAPVPGVAVTARDEERGVTSRAVTGSGGAFRIPLLRPGSYAVTAELAGFSPFHAGGLRLAVGQEAVLPIRLRAAAAAEVQVASAVELIDPTSSQVASIVTPRQVKTLPLATRNYLELALLAPGTTPGRDVAFSGVVAGGAQEARWTFVSLDGADNNNFIVGGQQANVSQDTVQEFQVVTNNFSAEYGRSNSVVVNVLTKSGTNDFHGTGYYYLRDDSLTAEPFFSGAPYNQPNDYTRQNWGATLGGPLVMDKAFFFGSFDKLNNDPKVVVNIPANPALDGSFPQEDVRKLAFVKADVAAGPQHHLTLSYRYDDRDRTNLNVGSQGGGNFAASYGYAQTTKTHGLILAHQWTPSGDTYNDARLTALLFDQNSPPNSADVGQQHATYSSGGNPRFPQGGKEQRYGIDDTFALTAGKHFLKLGAGFSRWKGDVTFNLFVAGQYTYLVNAAGVELGPRLYIKGSGNPSTLNTINFWNAFIQDEWRVTDRLTINVGVRYDLQDGALNSDFVFPQADANGNPLVRTPTSEDKNNIAPRLGFAYDLTGKGQTVLRGGAGMFYFEIFNNLSLNEDIFNGQNFVIKAYPCFAVPGVCNGVTAPDLTKLPAIGVAPEIRVNDPDMQTPYTMMASVGLSQAIGRKWALSADGVYVAGRHELGEVRENLRVDPSNPNSPRPIPQLGSVRSVHSDGNSTYYGLLASVRKAYSDGWQAQLSYTWSRATNEAEFFAVNVSDARSSDPFGQDRGPARNDQRHRVVANGSYDFFRGSLAEFSFGTIVTVGSGRPYSRLLGFDANLDDAPPFGQDRPAGFGRNSELSASYFRWDLRASKRFTFGPLGLELIAECFNVTNKRNFDPDTYSNVVSASDFGAPRPSTNDTYQARQLQLAARIDF